MNNTRLIETEVMTLIEAAEYLKLSEKTVHRMIGRQEIPCSRIGGQWRFLKSVIDDWMISKMQVIPRNDISRLLNENGSLVPISRLLTEGLITLGLSGNHKREILHQLCLSLIKQKKLTSVDFLLEKLLAREEMASTAIGSGIAIPHLRRPEENVVREACIVAGVSREGLDFAAFDRQPTYLFFLILTNSEAVHLKVMARLAALLKDQDFIGALRQVNTEMEFINLFIRQETLYQEMQLSYKTGGKNE